MCNSINGFIMDNVEITNKLEYRVIDYFCTFEYLLSYNNEEFPNYTTTCFCPFHENTNTKAAKYFNEEHNDHIFCFAENKLYKPHHLLTKGIVNFTPEHVFSAIWNNLSQSEKEIFSDDVNYKNITVDFSPLYNNYKKCKLDYFELLKSLRNT